MDMTFTFANANATIPPPIVVTYDSQCITYTVPDAPRCSDPRHIVATWDDTVTIHGITYTILTGSPFAAPE